MSSEDKLRAKLRECEIDLKAMTLQAMALMQKTATTKPDVATRAVERVAGGGKRRTKRRRTNKSRTKKRRTKRRRTKRS
jgi:hypothetical protein